MRLEIFTEKKSQQWQPLHIDYQQLINFSSYFFHFRIGQDFHNLQQDWALANELLGTFYIKDLFYIYYELCLQEGIGTITNTII